jgi:hypothetical protein
MKSKKTTPQPAGSKGKVKIKNLKLTKESIENLSDHGAGAVKGGGYSPGTRGGHT